MSSLSRFRLITFDVHNTLLQIRSAPGKKYGELGAMFGISNNNSQLVANYVQSWRKMNRLHPNFGLKTKIGYKQWWQMMIGGIFNENGTHNIPDDKIEQMTEHFMDFFKTSGFWQHCYGSIDFLNYLKLQKHLESSNSKDAPFKLGVISNFDPRLDVLLRNMKINHYFDFVLNSYDVGYMKPAKEIFEAAENAAELKDLKPHECLHIGATPVTDYFGSKNAGWYGLLVHEKSADELTRKYSQTVDDNHVFSSLFDIHKKISNDYMRW
ncbi:rhythmically expressed gene 2 protein [Malaya genurostris]|uniref:rhythmically expressed gene 2 protein n=1 Tax=Malaya genurostris TaxID=325434 RepID=UPI0026F3B8C3|nr:rhythmically expressed gene 2 protein [Malaya genurostris]